MYSYPTLALQVELEQERAEAELRRARAEKEALLAQELIRKDLEMKLEMQDRRLADEAARKVGNAWVTTCAKRDPVQ